jgi:serine/threonine-protein kinase ATR
MSKVLLAYPNQALWSMVSAAQSNVKKRSSRCLSCFDKVKVSKQDPLFYRLNMLSLPCSQTLSSQAENTPRHTPHHRKVIRLISMAQRLVDRLLHLCNAPVSRNELSMKNDFPELYALLPIEDLIIPLQNSLIVTLPAQGADLASHRPFPPNLVTFQGKLPRSSFSTHGELNPRSGFHDEIDIMPSLQKPRKITVVGSDGNSYSFLCKPNDDLRKDARLMEFNSMINKLLKRNSESRKRRLCLSTWDSCLSVVIKVTDIVYRYTNLLGGAAE